MFKTTRFPRAHQNEARKVLHPRRTALHDQHVATKLKCCLHRLRLMAHNSLNYISPTKGKKNPNSLERTQTQST